VRHLGDGREVGRDAAVGRADDDNQFRPRVGVEGGGDGGRVDAEADVLGRVESRRDVDRLRPGEDQGQQDRLVDVAGDDHLVAGADRCQHDREVAGGRAVDEEEGALGPERGRREFFRLLEDAAVEVGVVDAAAVRHVVAQGIDPEQVDQFRRGPDAHLVPGG